MDSTDAMIAAAKRAADVQIHRHAVVTLTMAPHGIIVRATATMVTAQGQSSQHLIVGWDEIMAERINVLIAAIDVVAGFYPARVFKQRAAN